MKVINNFVFLLIVSFCITGCVTTSPQLTRVPYSFANHGSETASITFISGNPGISLVYFEGSELPRASGNTHWDPILFPADRALKITVHAFYQLSNSSSNRAGVTLSNQGISVGVSMNLNPNSQAVNHDVVFECPPLEANASYRLTFRRSTPGRNILVLTNASTGRIIHEQEFEAR